ncbi:MAG TPA: FAD:protein FMN transferase [Acidimicrobiales bacterium]|nr:FAD:protein FMN transferase [Acidimicrobiales bacterium]
MPAELRFDAMGTSCLLAVQGDAQLLRYAVARVEQLEARWSRFRPDSEISRLRGANGVPTAVTADTYLLLKTACAAWRATAGRYDPTVLDAVAANGYDRSFADLDATSIPRSVAAAAPGCAAISFDADASTVLLPSGVGVDPGGIGKGLAGDMLVAELMACGAEGVLVDLGGDVRCAGQGPAAGRWVVDIADPFGKSALVHLALTDGAVATSSRLRRSWGLNGSWHHIVDPTSGAPATNDLVAATVVAGDGWWAEALATAVMVAGDTGVATNASVIAVRSDGSLTGTGDLLELAA